MSNAHEVQPLPPARTLNRRQQWRLLAIAAAVLVVAFLLVRLLGGSGAAPAEPAGAPAPAGAFRPSADQLRQMKIETVGDASGGGEVDATGVISVDENHSTPVLLPYSGQVAQVFVQAGQHVAQGQPLLRIASSDVVDARNALAAATATRATAEAQLKIATDNAARAQAIYQTAGGALKDYRQAQTDQIAAQATLRSADAALGAARDKLALFGQAGSAAGGGAASVPVAAVYRSPVSGVVATRDVAPGQYVGAGGDKPVMTIADFGHVWLIAQLPESETAAVSVGDRVQVTTPAYPGRTFAATIDNVAAQLDPATHRLPVRATVANPDGALKPQMFARFAIRRAATGGAGAGGAIRVPTAAVIHEGDSARVWVLGPDGALHARPVQIADMNDQTTTIAAGLNRGERIVTAGAIFVNEAGSGE